MQNQEKHSVLQQTTTTKVDDPYQRQQIFQYKRKWLAIGHGVHKEKSYQYVYRPFVKQSNDPAVRKSNDGIQVIPIIEYIDHKQIVFIANFRPAVGNFVVEFPAGLAEDGNNLDTVKRQLEQEVGLVPYKFVEMPSPVIYSDPHKGNESGIFYIALIDGSKVQSFVPSKRQKTENIRSYSMKYSQEKGICQNLLKFAQQNEYILQAKTWIVCMAVDLVDRLKEFEIKI